MKARRKFRRASTGGRRRAVTFNNDYRQFLLESAFLAEANKEPFARSQASASAGFVNRITEPVLIAENGVPRLPRRWR
jgi:hypothetical protein